MISPLSSSAPSFDHPLEMLHACHGKILRQCDTLKLIYDHLASYGCDADVQQAAQGMLRYFDSAGRFHHQDEELNLFPVLRCCTNTDQLRLNGLLEHLLLEHVVMMTAWEDLRGLLLKLAEGENTALPKTLVEHFISSHTAHIAIEEAELLPLAAQLLSTSQLMQLGCSMAERRCIKHTPGT